MIHPLKLRTIGGAAALLMVMLTGCQTMEYKGARPSFRTYADHPDIKDYYVGADLKFATDRADEYRPLHPVVSAGPITEDALDLPTSDDRQIIRSATIDPTRE